MLSLLGDLTERGDDVTPGGFVGRVGGLAAALGAGVVVGLAAASPAAADDTGAADTGPRSAASAHPAGRAAPDAARVSRRGTAAPSASTGSDPARQAAVVSASQVVRTAVSAAVPVPRVPVPRVPVPEAVAPESDSAPAAAEPVLAAAAAQVAQQQVRQSTVVGRPAAASPVASAPAPAAAATSLQSLFGDPRGRRITVFKGVHFVIPQSPAFFVKKVSGTGTFTTDSTYDLKDVDQYDWNKFTGIAFSPIQHDRNSVMVGWRYNLTSQEYEIAPFYNVNKERILPNEQTEVISVPAGETFQYNVDYTGVTINYADKTVFKPYPPGLTPNVWTSTRVSGWFGGNEVAPRTLTYYLKLK
jgi:hypothetical protein